MILHCVPPHRYDTPHYILGYLKGFLEAKGILAPTVYWNLILAEEIEGFKKSFESDQIRALSSFDITSAVWKWLMKSAGKIDDLYLDPLFLSIYTKEELGRKGLVIRNKIDEHIKEENLDRASLSGFTARTHQWMMSLYIMSRLKEMNPSLKTVITDATDENQARKFMEVFTEADFAVWGEAEYPLYFLAKALEEETSLIDVPQLVYRDNEEIISTNSYNDLNNLDEYPFADYSDYFQTIKRFMPSIQRVTIPVWGSRSCPWNKCKFCVINKRFTYRLRSPHNIVEEIEYQSKKHDTYTFIFMDSDVGGTKQRFKTLLTLLTQISANHKYHFMGTLSPVSINDDTARDLNQASFNLILVGFEAFTDSLLKKMQKQHTFADNIQALKCAHKYGIQMGGLSILKGSPSETTEDIQESLKNIKFLRFLLNTHMLNPTPLVLYKGSFYYEEMSEEERKSWNYHRFWLDIAPTRIIPEEDRFEFFGFYQEKSHRLWEDFDTALQVYKQQNRSYTWVEHDNGSLLEEKGVKTYKYTLDKTETQLLLFCDSIRHISEVKKEFCNEKTLLETMHTLNEVGLLYYDKNMHTIISVVEACRMSKI